MELKWVSYKSVNKWSKYHHVESQETTICSTLTACGRIIYGERVFTSRSNCSLSANLFCKQCERAVAKL